MSELVKDTVRNALKKALSNAQQLNELPNVPITPINIERPQNPEHGDYSSNIALRLAGTMKCKPLDIAEKIANTLPASSMIASAEVAPPGFINIKLSTTWKLDQIDAILSAEDSWGSINLGKGARVQVEFVSANPTGPLQVGNGRGAVLGDTLASVLEAAGYQVEREYYVNDTGGQIRTFLNTLYARYKQQFGLDVEMPEDGYQGSYMSSLAEQIKLTHGDSYLMSSDSSAPEALGSQGLDIMLKQIREDLVLLGVNFDTWFSEKSLYEPIASCNNQSIYNVSMEKLRKSGFVEENEGAVWFRSKELGEEKDNVLVRRTGEPTYFASDIAYHYNKFMIRKFDRVINIWGADHQGHVARTKTAVQAFSGPENGLNILLYQLVHLRRGGERVRMSKRTGEIVTLRELVEDVGVDAARYFLLQRSADAQMDFDLELASEQDPKQNPVSYIQYAHARCASIGRSATEKKIGLQGNVQLLTDPAEIQLVDEMLRLPEVIEMMAEKLEPHHLTTYAMNLAQHFTQFYGSCRVIDEEQPELTEARLKLTIAAGKVIARTLKLMGLNTPERM